MKKINLSLIILVAFSLFAIVYFNPLSIAQDSKENEAKIESEVYKQLEENEKVTIIVKLKNNFQTENIDQIKKISKENIKKLTNELEKKSSNFELVQSYETFNALALKIDKETLEILKNNEIVEEIHAEQILSIQLQQSLPLINATQAWNVASPYGGNLTGRGQTICVLDTGIDYTNPALGGTFGVKVIAGHDFVNNDTDPNDDNGHGTHVAGIIAANGIINTTLVRGVAPDAYLVAEKVCNATGSCFGSSMLAGINHCLSTVGSGKLTAISISIGDGNSWNQTTCPTWMNAPIDIAASKGIPVIVSSGNQGFKNGISYPACSPNATAVGNTYDANHSGLGGGGLTLQIPNGTCTDGVNATVDKITCNSNTFSNLDLVAPGTRITSTRPVGVFPPSGCNSPSATSLIMTCSGTSQAAAHVTGAVALIKQKNGPYIPKTYGGKIRLDKLLRNSNKMVTDPVNGLIFPRLSLQHLI